MAEKKRKADVFAKPGSLLDKLKKRRQAYESGDPEQIEKAAKETKKKKKEY